MRRLALTLLFGLLATASSAQEPGTFFQDCEACPEMAVLPAGTFTMGSNEGTRAELPAHPVTIAEPFAMARTETTWAQWDACRAEGVCTREPDDHDWGRETRPVVNISWQDAIDFTTWLSKKTGHKYRLPSEAEWEYAARGGTQTPFWWGSEVGENKVNCRHCGSKWSGTMSAPTRSFEANPFGLYDMSGNVWEWTRDCWLPHYVAVQQTHPAPYDPPECSHRVTRGGAWYYIPRQARVSARVRNDPRLWSYTIGFRVVRELD